MILAIERPPVWAAVFSIESNRLCTPSVCKEPRASVLRDKNGQGSRDNRTLERCCVKRFPIYVNGHGLFGLHTDQGAAVETVTGIANMESSYNTENRPYCGYETGAGKDIDVEEAIIQARIGGDTHFATI